MLTWASKIRQSNGPLMRQELGRLGSPNTSRALVGFGQLSRCKISELLVGPRVFNVMGNRDGGRPEAAVPIWLDIHQLWQPQGLGRAEPQWGLEVARVNYVPVIFCWPQNSTPRTRRASPSVAAMSRRGGISPMPTARTTLAHSALGGFWALPVRRPFRGSCGVALGAGPGAAARIVSAVAAVPQLAGTSRIPAGRTTLAQVALEGYWAPSVRQNGPRCSHRFRPYCFPRCWYSSVSRQADHAGAMRVGGICGAYCAWACSGYPRGASCLSGRTPLLPPSQPSLLFPTLLVPVGFPPGGAVLARCALEGFRALSERRLLRDTVRGVLRITRDSAAPIFSAFAAVSHLAAARRIPA